MGYMNWGQPNHEEGMPAETDSRVETPDEGETREQATPRI